MICDPDFGPGRDSTGASKGFYLVTLPAHGHTSGNLKNVIDFSAIPEAWVKSVKPPASIGTPTTRPARHDLDCICV